MTTTSYCGDCGQALQPIHGTATIACCSGRYYWTELAPLPRDNLVPVPTCRVKERTFYRYEWREKLESGRVV